MTRTRILAAALAACLALVAEREALAYLKLGVNAGGRMVTLKWTRTPVRYFISNGDASSATAADLQGAASRAFATWQGIDTASIAYQFVGYTSAQPGDDDGLTTLGFQSRPELDRVLASTSFLIDTVTGELLESDIFFNCSFAWSAAANGQPGRYDLESIALHEIGHLNGLGHSMIGETEPAGSGGRRVLSAEAVMFPIAYQAGNTSARTPRADDVAGISDLYPDGDFLATSGSLSGRVTKNGTGVYGAHVLAFNPETGTMVANFSLDAQGHFSIAGLSPGPHVVRVEPLDDADVSSFFDSSAAVDVNFRVTYHDRLVVVPRGGDSGEVEIRVQPR